MFRNLTVEQLEQGDVEQCSQPAPPLLQAQPGRGDQNKYSKYYYRHNLGKVFSDQTKYHHIVQIFQTNITAHTTNIPQKHHHNTIITSIISLMMLQDLVELPVPVIPPDSDQISSEMVARYPHSLIHYTCSCTCTLLQSEVRSSYNHSM